MKTFLLCLAGFFFGATAGLTIYSVILTCLGQLSSFPLVLAFATFSVSFIFLLFYYLKGGLRK